MVRTLLLLALTLAAACHSPDRGLPYYDDASLTPLWPDARASAGIHRVADFSALDQNGNLYSADSLDGRIHIANFFFATCSDVCPITTRHLKTVVDSLGGDGRFIVISISVTPDRDSVATLARYAQHNGIDVRHWRLLTAPDSVVKVLARSYLVGLGRGSDYGTGSVAHTEMLVLLDENRHVRGVYNGTLQLDMKQLVADARTLLRQLPATAPVASRKAESPPGTR